MTVVEGTPPITVKGKHKQLPQAFHSTKLNSTVGRGMGMAVVHATNASDPFLVSWTEDARNPIHFSSGVITSPYDTPGQEYTRNNVI